MLHEFALPVDLAIYLIFGGGGGGGGFRFYANLPLVDRAISYLGGEGLDLGFQLHEFAFPIDVAIKSGKGFEVMAQWFHVGRRLHGGCIWGYMDTA